MMILEKQDKISEDNINAKKVAQVSGIFGVGSEGINLTILFNIEPPFKNSRKEIQIFNNFW